jgi:lysophospholipase L1-like esterase
MEGGAGEAGDAPRGGLMAASPAVVLLAAILAAGGGPAPSKPSRPAPLPTLTPAPLVSRGKRVESRPRGGRVLVDGLYRTSETWSGGTPTEASPSWAAIEMGTGFTRLLLVWSSSHNHDWTERFYGAPEEYRIETSADSTDGQDGTWRTAVAVTANPVRTRAHAVEFAGQRWIRLVVTKLPAKVHRWGLHLDEIDLHDLSRGGDDVWIFLGDSITAGVFDRSPVHQPSFAAWIARRHPGYHPAMVEVGKGNLHHPDALALLEQALALTPEARVVALGFGSNDWDPVAYRKDLRAVVDRVRAAGKIPIVARMPFRADAKEDFPARLNAVVDAVTREEGLLPGPDLYTYFKAHPERLQDGLHPDDAGSVEMSRLWAEAVDRLYPR